jgi:hypothetical protein
VVVRSAQKVYWAGALVGVDWSRADAVWRFLVALAEKGRRGAVVEARDLYDRPVGNSTLGNLLSRLKKMVSAGLWKHIRPSRDPHGYRLELDRHRVFLF